jgi:hypothetical protein
MHECGMFQTVKGSGGIAKPKFLFGWPDVAITALD